MISVEPLGRLVPGVASAPVVPLSANNNLDLCRYRGRWYLVWRTAPTHFASPGARLEVTSADHLDGPWRHEVTIAVGADVREPRLVVDGDRLLLFFFELGIDPSKFQPRRVLRVVLGAGGWTDPEVVFDDPIVPWRIRRLDGRWVLTSYRGAERMYGPRPEAPVVEVRTSVDLETWSEPVVIHHGGTECELVVLDDGRWVGVVRNEGPTRFGSDLLVGPSLDQLTLTAVRPKLDSPHLFVWEGRPWLVARRSLAFGGRYDLAPRWVPGALAIRIDQLAWWVTRKRSALWRVDPDTPDVRPVVDLPSGGDTSFAAVVVDDDGSLVVADYRSPGPSDPVWVRGQLRPTVIDAVRITDR